VKSVLQVKNEKLKVKNVFVRNLRVGKPLLFILLFSFFIRYIGSLREKRAEEKAEAEDGKKFHAS